MALGSIIHDIVSAYSACRYYMYLLDHKFIGFDNSIIKPPQQSSENHALMTTMSIHDYVYCFTAHNTGYLSYFYTHANIHCKTVHNTNYLLACFMH